MVALSLGWMGNPEDGTLAEYRNQPLDIMPKPYDTPHARNSYPFDGWAIEIAAWSVIAVVTGCAATTFYCLFKYLAS